MPIATNDQIVKFGTLTTVSAGAPAAIASAAFSVIGDIVAWTNTDDAPNARFSLKGQWAKKWLMLCLTVVLRLAVCDLTLQQP